MKKEMLNRHDGTTLPSFSHCDMETVYTLLPHNFSLEFYYQRVNRNLGWLTADEQDMLREAVVSIAGCGGMGGQVAATLLRLGVGEIRLADPETFDVSNLNRQFAAKRATMGVNKALATAHELRSIADDSTIKVYPMGIQENTVAEFVEGADMVCDLIEFWIVWYRIILHEEGRRKGVSLLNCNTVGHRTNIFLFTPDSMTMEESLGIDWKKAVALRDGSKDGSLSLAEREAIMSGMIRAVVPGGIPEYGVPGGYSTSQSVARRLKNEMVASIVATNPVVAGGIMATHILFQLIGRSPDRRIFKMVPPMPGYLSFDAALNETFLSTEKYW